MPWCGMARNSMLWTDGWTSGTLLLVPTLYFWFSKVLVDSSPTSFFLFSPTNSAATWAGRTFSSSSRVRFSHSSISSLSVRFLFFSRNSWRQQNSSCMEEERKGFTHLQRWKCFSFINVHPESQLCFVSMGFSWKAMNAHEYKECEKIYLVYIIWLNDFFSWFENKILLWT